MSNSNASDGFPFTAQKRQLEDAGKAVWLNHFYIVFFSGYFCAELICKTDSRLQCTYLITLQMSRRARSWLRRVTWIQRCVSFIQLFYVTSCALLWLCDFIAYFSKLHTTLVCTHIPFRYSPLVIQNLSLVLVFHTASPAIGAQLAALAQQRWVLVVFSTYV